MKNYLQKTSQYIKAKPYLALLVVLLICFFIRAYHLIDLFPFTMDEEYQAFLANNTIKTGHIPLIGVNVANTGLYLGPLFTWISTILYWFANGSPIITAWVSVLISITTCWLLIKTINLLTKDYWLSLIGGLLYSLNPLIVMYDHKFWNPSLVMCLTVFWLFSLLKSAKNQKWWIGVFAVLGLSFHIHYSLFILILPTFVEIFRQWKLIKLNKRKIFVKNITIKFILIIGICILPLLIFEIRHNFIQLTSFRQYLFFSEKINLAIWYRFWILYASVNRLLWLGFNRDLAIEMSLASSSKSTLLMPLSIIFPLSLTYIYFGKRYWQFGKIFITIFISFITALLFFKSLVSEYYFLPLFPLCLILIMLVLTQHIESRGIKAEYYLGLLLALVLAVWAGQSLTLKNTLGLKTKLTMIDNIKNLVDNKPYELNAKGKYAYEGYRYLTSWQRVTPVKSYMDEQFDWLYGSNKALPKTNITIYYKYEPNLLTLIKSGKFDQLIETENFVITRSNL